ncbi:DUF397 domain-containing protein [Actinomadura alba]|uniref:DUF397 domain-containing protein n=1 Tax=Actinomadura alba TaxID=406431 RepID=A0ABR7LXV7_9ACTN|nr:DUF397 domain-containing protein [Actinomadura alba]MBC6469688.1 DUF397 domain-containing protein [Actinomadura alba]
MTFDVSSAQWRKSSRSGSSGDQCVEVADLYAAIGVRDSKDPGGPELTFTPGEWKTFTAYAKAGRHDLT